MPNLYSLIPFLSWSRKLLLMSIMGLVLLSPEVYSQTTLSIAATDADKAEGDMGTINFTFTVTRAGMTDGTSEVDWAVAPATGMGINPVEATDFIGDAFQGGTLMFAADDLSETITVTVKGELNVEADEVFTVTLSNPDMATITAGMGVAQGTIQNDDAELSIAANDADKVEGTGMGNTAFTFTITRNGSTAGSASVEWEVSGIGANPSNATDFAATMGTVNFTNNQGNRTLTINVVRDASVESDETFQVLILNATNASIVSGGNTANGTIQNDDNPPSDPIYLVAGDTFVEESPDADFDNGAENLTVSPNSNITFVALPGGLQYNFIVDDTPQASNQTSNTFTLNSPADGTKIRVRVTDANGDRITENIVIRFAGGSAGNPFDPGVPAQICSNGNPVEVQVRQDIIDAINADFFITFQGLAYENEFGIRLLEDTDPGTNFRYLYDPVVAGAGSGRRLVVVARLFGFFDYIYAQQENITVTAPPSLTIGGLSPTYCPDDGNDAFTLSTPGTVVYEMRDGANTVLGNDFVNASGANPVLEIEDLVNGPGIGSYTLNVTSTLNSCTTVESFDFEIVSTQTVTFSAVKNANTDNSVIASNGEICLGDSITFASTTPLDPMLNYDFTWDFGDGTSSKAENPPAKIYNTLGDKTVQLIIREVGNPCANISENFIVQVGEVPEPDFTLMNACQGDPIMVVNNTPPLENAVGTNWLWEFINENNVTQSSTDETPNFPFTDVGVYEVRLTASNEDFNCSKSITKFFTIFPLITVDTNTPYGEDFETNDPNRRWIHSGETNPEGARNSSWQQKNPAGSNINMAAGGSQSWITANAQEEHNSNETSWVESPCFDINTLDKPLMSLDIWRDMENNLDGVAIEYTVDNGASWNAVGALGEGQAWYNRTSIFALGQPPLSILEGWTDSEVGAWENARINLQDIQAAAQMAGEPLRLRVVFASNATNGGDFNGFAFDNVLIASKNRVSLIEHFVNSNDSPSLLEADAIEAFAGTITDGSIFDVYYHTSFPGSDPVNASNPADPSARALQYGVSTLPSTILDGIFTEEALFSSGWGASAYSQRTLDFSPFDITVSNLSGGTGANPLGLTVDISKINTPEPISNPILLRAAIVEYLAEGQYRNALRQFLPDAAGTRLDGTWAAIGETRTEQINLEWVPSRDANPNEFAVLLFLQDELSGEIYQAEVVNINFALDIPGGRANNPNPNIASERLDFKIYPNPSAEDCQLEFNQVLTKKYVWRLQNSWGQEVLRGEIQENERASSLDLPPLPAGIYTLEIGGVQKKLFITK